MRNLLIAEVAFGRGANDPGCADGPLALRSRLSRLRSQFHLHWHLHWDLDNRPLDEAVSILMPQITQTVREALRRGDELLVIGGDHSVGIGTWTGVAQHLGRQPLGLIWLDAHLDSHTPHTSHSGNLHGMPLAILLGQGEHPLRRLNSGRPALLPQHVVHIGARSFEPEEADLLDCLGVRYMPMGEVTERGLLACLEEATERLRGTATGLSIDLDVVDPAEAPGVGCPVPDGLSGQELRDGLAWLTERIKPIAMEMVEYNPHRDINGKTADLALHVLEDTLYGPN